MHSSVRSLAQQFEGRPPSAGSAGRSYQSLSSSHDRSQLGEFSEFASLCAVPAPPAEPFPLNQRLDPLRQGLPGLAVPPPPPEPYKAGEAPMLGQMLPVPQAPSKQLAKQVVRRDVGMTLDVPSTALSVRRLPSSRSAASSRQGMQRTHDLSYPRNGRSSVPASTGSNSSDSMSEHSDPIYFEHREPITARTLKAWANDRYSSSENPPPPISAYFKRPTASRRFPC
ncbi:hypothetical protein DIPPA_57663 [Diplonema papillatum]|nr:hypothetical protein DIPPA_57663 [Diplonema papillatum]